jgi:hypothetical protein
MDVSHEIPWQHELSSRPRKYLSCESKTMYLSMLHKKMQYRSARVHNLGTDRSTGEERIYLYFL